MIERERKFALKWMPSVSLKIEIKQAYILFEGNKHLRVRIIDDQTAFLTFKTIHTADYRIEYEYNIPIDDAIELYHSANLKLMKTRYQTDFMGNHVDIDIYPCGLSVVEIEFEDELKEIPDYCGEELTGNSKYSNISIALTQSAQAILRLGNIHS